MPSGLRQILLHKPLCGLIEGFWCKEENKRAASWLEHLDINVVMLATSLAPDGYFGAKKNLTPSMD